jgi:hypothetical protein
LRAEVAIVGVARADDDHFNRRIIIAIWCVGCVRKFLRKEGMGEKEIARAVGCKRGNVCKTLKAAGLK